MNITYTKRGDIYYPDFTLPEQSSDDIGRFGRMRRRYLKEHRKAYYSILCMKLELNDHLREINRQASEAYQHGGSGAAAAVYRACSGDHGDSSRSKKV